jgi:hypothetical protein
VEVAPTEEETKTSEPAEQQETPVSRDAKQRKTLKSFMDTFKNNLIEMFKEEEDSQL